MKKIIRNGDQWRRYDTETAKEVGSWSNGLSYRDFTHVKETLYRKKTGEFFLYGCGGPNTHYRRRVGSNEWSGGEDIRPLTIEEAKEWAASRLDGDEFEDIFGPVEEDDAKKTVSFSLRLATIDKIEKIALSKGIKKSEVIDYLVSQA